MGLLAGVTLDMGMAWVSSYVVCSRAGECCDAPPKFPVGVNPSAPSTSTSSSSSSSLQRQISFLVSQSLAPLSAVSVMSAPQNVEKKRKTDRQWHASGKMLEKNPKVFFSSVDVQRQLSGEVVIGNWRKEGLIRTACRPLRQVVTYRIIPQAYGILPIQTEKGMNLYVLSRGMIR